MWLEFQLDIYILHYYGFSHAAIKWFSSYLSFKTQAVEIKKEDGSVTASEYSFVGRGVPQGSILGPLLFILYCADIVTQIKACRFHHQHIYYADDIQLYIYFKPSETDSAIDRLNNDLKNIALWSEAN